MNTIKLTHTETPNKYDDKTRIHIEMKQHRKDVYNVMNEIAWNIYQNGVMHDWTKESFFEDYYQDIIDRQTETDFEKREWYKIHTKYERHHINQDTPIDVNLIDILEMITDKIVTGKTTNNGKVEPNYLKIDNETLQEAYWNTITLICENTTVTKEP